MKPIIGSGGKTLGYEREIGDRIELLKPGGEVVGIYFKDKDQTVKPGGSLVGYGNLLYTLLD